MIATTVFVLCCIVGGLVALGCILGVIFGALEGNEWCQIAVGCTVFLGFFIALLWSGGEVGVWAS